MNPVVEDRLRAHVAAILAGAGIPADARSDLEEELLGHLVERFQALIEDGLPEAESAEQAISDFGTASSLGSELGRTYHSRLWASTIGMLLPAIAPATARPGVIGWLRFVLGLAGVRTVIALATVATTTPLRALGSAIALLAGLAALILAFQALVRGQRWALIYAICVSLLLLVEGIGHVIAPPQPGITVPLGAILAACVLLAARNGWAELQAFVAPSPRLNRALGVALAFSLLAPSIVPRALAALPDPSQAIAEDLELVLSMSCDRGDVAFMDGPTMPDAQRATLVIDTSWSHTDLLPYGLAGVLTHPDDADTSGLRAIHPRPWLWSYFGEPTVVDTTTGQTAGWWGSTSPSVGLLPADVAGSLTIAIDRGAIHPGRIIRTTWLLSNAGADQEGEWPRIEVFYAHLDRFVLAGTVGCGESVRGREVSPHQPVLTDPFPFP